MDEYNSIQGLLSILNLKVIKLTALTSGAKYFIYRPDPIKNLLILSAGVKYSIVDDIVSHFSRYDIDWYSKIQPGEKNKTFKKGVAIVKDYVSYNCECCSLVTNNPGEELKYSEKGVTYFNLFQNTELLVEKPIFQKDFSVIEKIIFNLCSEDVEKYEWVMNWFKCIYIQPDFRFTTSIVFIGEPGTGKGMLTEVLRHIFQNTCYRANSKDLVSNFNSQLFEGKYLLLANEILDQNKKYQFSNDLKEYITEKEISVEGKYMSRYVAKNYVKLIMFSNSKQPIVIEESDRRYFVSASKKRIDKILTKEELNKFWELGDFFKNQVEGFCAYLNSCVDYDFDKVTKEPPLTEEKKNIIDIHKTDFKQIIEEIIKDAKSGIEYDVRQNAWIEFSLLYNLYHNEDYQRYRKKTLTKKKFAAKLNIEGFKKQKNSINSTTKVRVGVPEKIIDEINNTEEGVFR